MSMLKNTSSAQEQALHDEGRSTSSVNIESYNSPKTNRPHINVRHLFSFFLFAIVFLVAGDVCFAVRGGMDIWAAVVALVCAAFAVSAIHIDPEWERAIVLRFGKFHRAVEPGLYFTIPIVDNVVLHVDQRVMLTGFSAEETLTADLVPVNVDAAIFWMVWDPEKACMEVEDYYNSVALAAQISLRDAIGRKSIADVATQRVQLDSELKSSIEEKTSVWGVTVLSVEIRDIVIPKDLQEAMSAEARAERRRDSRMTLAEAEKDIAHMLVEASKIYGEEEGAMKLRSLHLLSEGVNESNSTLVVPSPYAEGFAQGIVKETSA